MKNFFLIFGFILFGAGLAQARLADITAQSAMSVVKQPAQPTELKQHQLTRSELVDFLEDRVKKVVSQKKEDVSTANIDTVPSDATQKQLNEKEKSEFQRIYEAALEKINDKKEVSDAPDLRQQLSKKKQEVVKPDFPVIEAVLPDSPEKVLIPAREHIPYLMAKIDILPDGVVKIEDTITIATNGIDIRNGVYKYLPSTLILRNGKKQNLSYTFVGATVNGQPIDYKIKSLNDRFVLTPNNDLLFPAGVYTYKFEYLAHNLIGFYEDFDEFYWDVTGSTWNLVIGKVGATITYPRAGEPLGQAIIIGSADNLSTNGGAVVSVAPSTYGYRSYRPLFLAEGFHVISSIPHGIVSAPTWGDKLFLQISEHSDIVFMAVTLAMIWIGFLASKRYIRRNVGQLKITIKKSSAMMRFLVINRYDIKSFLAFILELYKKNIIDIQQSDDTILLVKRTDNIKSLSKPQQKAVFALFGTHDAVFNINKNNLIKLKRASKHIGAELRRSMAIFRLKLNSGYILLSLGMLLLGEIFSALYVENMAILKVLLVGDLLLIIGSLLFCTQFVRSLFNIIAKAIGTATILLTLVMMSTVISKAAAVLIFASIVTIFYYTTRYSKKDGLLKPYIDDALRLKEQLLHQKEALIIGKGIASHQANIFALDLEKDFIGGPANEYNKLEAVIAILQKLG